MGVKKNTLKLHIINRYVNILKLTSIFNLLWEQTRYLLIVKKKNYTDHAKHGIATNFALILMTSNSKYICKLFAYYTYQLKKLFINKYAFTMTYVGCIHLNKYINIFFGLSIIRYEPIERISKCLSMLLHKSV